MGTMTFTRIDRGDFNADGSISSIDIDMISAELLKPTDDPLYDVNNDGVVDVSDRTYWVRDIQETVFGDANLDGLFDSRDLVDVFVAGEFEDALIENSTWATGDWDGDLEFKTSDLVFAFQSCFECENAMQPLAVSVPEPANRVVGIFAVGSLLGYFRRFVGQNGFNVNSDRR